jgi:hypothetical protein
MVEYAESLDGVNADDLHGFFVGWRNVPSPEQHLAQLHGSAHVVLARDGVRVVGFVTAISDGVRRMLARPESLYMVDLCCDADLEPFYKRFGLRTWDRGMGLRR